MTYLLNVPRFGGTGSQTTTVNLGSDISRHSNDLAKKTIILAADGEYLLEEHRLTFGYQFKQTRYL